MATHSSILTWIEPGLATRFIHDILHVSMPFSLLRNLYAQRPQKGDQGRCTPLFLVGISHRHRPWSWTRSLCSVSQDSTPKRSSQQLTQHNPKESKAKAKAKSLSRVRLLVTPWTAAYQAPPSMGFSRQEYWSGVPLPSPKGK